MASRAAAPHSTVTGGGNVRVSRSPHFELEYEIEPNVPDALARVELWVTADRGLSWEPFGQDTDRQSPFPVQVDEEGIYGFRIVLHSAEGLSSRPPRPGERPDMWVLADWTDPAARLTSARYGTGVDLGKLLISWTANDRHLLDRPISLFFSPSREGPWTTIVAGLANTGSYAWQIGDQIPDDFYLRLEVRDQSGNVGVDQLNEPISSSGLAPQARIRAVRPIDGPDSSRDDATGTDS